MNDGKKAEGYFSIINAAIVQMIPECPGRILDIGCADGSLGERIISCKKPEAYIGVELIRSVADKAKTRLTDVYTGSADAILPALRDSTFDWIIMADSFEHMADPWKTTAELARILKPGGHLALSVPNVGNLNVILDLFFRGQWNYAPSGILDRGHVRFFTRASIRQLLTDFGFRMIRCFSNPKTRWKKPRGKIIARLLCCLIGRPSAYEEFIAFQWIVEAQKK